MTTPELTGVKKLFPQGLPLDYLENLRPMQAVLPPKKFRHIAGLTLRTDVILPPKEINAFGRDLWYEAILKGVGMREVPGTNYLRKLLFRSLIEETPVEDRQAVAQWFIKRYPHDPEEIYLHIASNKEPPKPLNHEEIAQRYIEKALGKETLKDMTISEELIDVPEEVFYRVRDELAKSNIEIDAPVEQEAGEGCYYVTTINVKPNEIRASQIRDRLSVEFAQSVEEMVAGSTIYEPNKEITGEYLDEQVMEAVVQRLKKKGIIAEIRPTGYSSSERTIFVINNTPGGMGQTPMGTASKAAELETPAAPSGASKSVPVQETRRLSEIEELTLTLGQPDFPKDGYRQLQRLIEDGDLVRSVHMGIQAGSEEEMIAFIQKLIDNAKVFNNPKIGPFLDKLLQNVMNLKWGDQLMEQLRKNLPEVL